MVDFLNFIVFQLYCKFRNKVTERQFPKLTLKSMDLAYAPREGHVAEFFHVREFTIYRELRVASVDPA